ncbi:MAG: ATP-grasp domain-containing protein [Thaumarchaeota archaeon]|nr:ATP-grasp domain-containing protein [Nitrososphaerota archaeon]MCL5318704.1 ATP-grasp domain-containing protein [Nitrososphaerota archaeon]
MTVNIFEYASGGGFRGQRIPLNIFCEGYSMLKSVAEDFHAAGYTVRCLLDSRVDSLRSDLSVVDDVVEVSPNSSSIQDIFVKMLQRSELSLVIAPETGGVLSSLIRLVEESSSASLNSASKTADEVSDKASLSELLGRNGVAVPETKCFSTEDSLDEVLSAYLRFSEPTVVVKPVDGVSCESTFLVSNRAEMIDAYKNLSENRAVSHFIIQRFVEGLPASVSLISNGRNAQPIALNLQRVTLNPPGAKVSSYRGGLTPLHHPDAEKALQVARRAVQVFGGLRGYVGVDLVLSPNGPVVLEVNPRLTVSYVGLRQVLKQGLAEPMVMAALNGVLPASFDTTGFSVFSKLPHGSAKNRVAVGSRVMCPPVEVDGASLAETLLVSWREREDEALRLLSAQERMAVEASRK